MLSGRKYFICIPCTMTQRGRKGQMKSFQENLLFNKKAAQGGLRATRSDATPLFLRKCGPHTFQDHSICQIGYSGLIVELGVLRCLDNKNSRMHSYLSVSYLSFFRRKSFDSPLSSKAYASRQDLASYTAQQVVNHVFPLWNPFEVHRWMDIYLLPFQVPTALKLLYL